MGKMVNKEEFAEQKRICQGQFEELLGKFVALEARIDFLEAENEKKDEIIKTINAKLATANNKSTMILRQSGNNLGLVRRSGQTLIL